MNLTAVRVLLAMPYFAINYNRLESSLESGDEGKCLFVYDELMYSYRYQKVIPGGKRLHLQAMLLNYQLSFEGYSKRWRGALANARFAPREYISGSTWAANNMQLKRLMVYYGEQYEPHDYLVAAQNVERLITCLVFTLKEENSEGEAINLTKGLPSATYLALIRLGAKQVLVAHEYYDQLSNITSNNITITLYNKNHSSPSKTIANFIILAIMIYILN